MKGPSFWERGVCFGIKDTTFIFGKRSDLDYIARFLNSGGLSYSEINCFRIKADLFRAKYEVKKGTKVFLCNNIYD